MSPHLLKCFRSLCARPCFAPLLGCARALHSVPCAVFNCAAPKYASMLPGVSVSSRVLALAEVDSAVIEMVVDANGAPSPKPGDARASKLCSLSLTRTVRGYFNSCSAPPLSLCALRAGRAAWRQRRLPADTENHSQSALVL